MRLKNSEDVSKMVGVELEKRMYVDLWEKLNKSLVFNRKNFWENRKWKCEENLGFYCYYFMYDREVEL